MTTTGRIFIGELYSKENFYIIHDGYPERMIPTLASAVERARKYQTENPEFILEECISLELKSMENLDKRDMTWGGDYGYIITKEGNIQYVFDDDISNLEEIREHIHDLLKSVRLPTSDSSILMGKFD